MRVHQQIMTHVVSLYSNWSGRDPSRTIVSDLDILIYTSKISQTVSIDMNWKHDLFEFHSRHRLVWFSDIFSLLYFLT